MGATSTSFSIIIPVYNDPVGLRKTLDSLLSQRGSSPEIIIVDNNSTDNTFIVGSDYSERYPNVKVISEARIQSSYAARNAGIEHSNGDVLVFIDADITVKKGWLKTIRKEIEGCDYLTYDVEVYTPASEETLVARYNEHTSFPIKEYAKERDFGGGGCIAVRRDVFEQLGLFDHRLISGGDAEFGNRVANSGRKITFTPKTKVYHPARASLRSQIKKEVRVGRGFCQLQRYYPDRYGHPGIPPLPSGSGESTTQTDLDIRDQLIFWWLGIFFLGCRGFGYLLELLTGNSKKRPNEDPPHEDSQ